MSLSPIRFDPHRVGRARRVLLLAAVLALVPAAAAAQTQVSTADYERAESVNDRFGPLTVGQPSDPTWTGVRFWYSRSVEGGNEWLLFDAATLSKAPLFDHARMAAAVSGDRVQAIDSAAARCEG